VPRAHRYFLPNHVWHITHRCHQREFLLKFSRDRRRWVYWLYEAKKRFGLCVLNYVVTSNHIHLLVRGREGEEIARSMQLIAGRTAQEFNQRKQRKGAFWEDRYHATAVDTDEHLARCLVYIDLNMVRAGVVSHPNAWVQGGYHEIQNPPKRYATVNLAALCELLGMRHLQQLQQAHAQWVEEALRAHNPVRDPIWTEGLAVGGRSFVERVQDALGVKARYRDIADAGSAHVLRESAGDYTVSLDQ